MPLTIGEYLRHLAPALDRAEAPYWPPDAFAFCAALLYRSGAYTSVVERWPPDKAKTKEQWLKSIRKIAKGWRKAAPLAAEPPEEIRTWWKTVRRAKSVSVTDVPKHPHVTDALLQIVSAADEACVGIGFPTSKGPDAFEFDALPLFLSRDVQTLCREVERDRGVVLPKAHTPQNGITIRSLTHNLALYLPGEVTPRWWFQPSERLRREWFLNVLILPWPRVVLPRHFSAIRRGKIEMAEGFGFFDCDVRKDGDFELSDVVKAHEAACERLRYLYGEDGCSIDGIVFPELALRPNEPLQIAQQTSAFVVGGVGARLGDARSRNYAAVVIPPATAPWPQHKHHRWKLTSSQIEQYGLGSRLDPTVQWWENMQLENRELNFFALNDWLTFSVFICEDLARPDPVSDLIRAVGPNLVICLLLDGPQLATRWPGRYATVLADDPGCSVLTVTSIGMAQICIPPGKEPSRVVALWRDARSPGPTEIVMEEDSLGVVLTLRREYVEEYAADSRSDESATAYLRLDRVHQIKKKAPSRSSRWTRGAAKNARTALTRKKIN